MTNCCVYRVFHESQIATTFFDWRKFLSVTKVFDDKSMSAMRESCNSVNKGSEFGYHSVQQTICLYICQTEVTELLENY